MLRCHGRSSRDSKPSTSETFHLKINEDTMNGKMVMVFSQF